MEIILLPKQKLQILLQLAELMQSRKMQVESPIPSPDVTCYEECVVAEEEVFISPSTDSNTNPDLASPVPRTNKNLGRVTKKSEN